MDERVDGNISSDSPYAQLAMRVGQNPEHHRESDRRGE
jgi:hypothetical protein